MRLPARVMLAPVFASLLLLVGCQGDRAHRADAAALAANAYAAAQAAQEGADLAATMTAVRLYCEKIAELHGFTIAGFIDWQKTLPKGPAK